MASDNPNTEGQPGLGQKSWVEAALFGLCPKCGAKTLFVGPVRFADKCTACGLDYGRFNVGDGPAAFLTLIIGALITGLAIWLDVSVRPPFWVHVILWVPLTALAVVYGLRVAKGALLHAEFTRKAGEAGRDDP